MDLKLLVDALPMATTSPYAFTSYVFLIVAWVVVVFRVRRYKILLEHLKNLPAKDRLSALKLEVHEADLKEGISPEQWIKSRTHRYYFLAFIAICVVITVIVVTVLNQSFLNRADLDISLQPSEEKAPSDALSLLAMGASSGKLSYPSYDFRMSFTGMITDPQFTDLRLSYIADQFENLSVHPSMPYLESVRSGGELVGFRYWNRPFQWSYPRLSLKMVNNTKNTIFLNKIRIHVKNSSVNAEPIPIFRENFYNVGAFEVVNEGHGKIINPTFQFKVLNADAAISDGDFSNLPNRKTFSGSFDEIEVPIKDYVSEELISTLNEPVVCVMGIVTYLTESGQKRKNTFKTRVSLAMPPPGAPAPPNFKYTVFLKAGKSGYVEEVPISQAIKPGDYDHFLLEVATDKSAEFSFDIEVQSLSGFQYSKDDVKLSLFVPRSAADEVLRDVERSARLKTPWANANVEVNELIREYSKIRAELAAAGIPVDGTFGKTSDGSPTLKKFIASFGRKIPVGRVNDIVKILQPLGLDAIDVGEKDYHENSIYIGSFDYQGVSISAEVLNKLRSTNPESVEWISFVEEKRVRLAEND